MLRSLLSICYCATALLVLIHPEAAIVKASPIPFQDLDFAVALTDESFEHETQASTGQTTGSWLVWFYNDKMADDHEQHKAILGKVPEGGGDGDGNNIFSEHHIVLGSVGLSKGTRTRQRFGIKPKDLPVLIFIHKGKYYVYPKSSDSSSSSESSSSSFYFNWDSIVKFAFHIAGYKQPSSSSSAAAAEEQGEGEEERSAVVGNDVGEGATRAEIMSNSIFAKLQAHDIPDPKTDWDDFQDFLTSMFNEGGFFFGCLSVVFGVLGIAACFNQMQSKPKEKIKEKTNKKKQQ